uniref:(northern house mosquito) hypothetical protein n=1 Tax=Culex pipiens TaxID=7175 RepID=A0A8D8HTU3_CULPI
MGGDIPPLERHPTDARSSLLSPLDESGRREFCVGGQVYGPLWAGVLSEATGQARPFVPEGVPGVDAGDRLQSGQFVVAWIWKKFSLLETFEVFFAASNAVRDFK